MPIIFMPKEYWLYNQFSVAKNFGGINITEGADKYRLLIIDRNGNPLKGNLYQENVPADLVDEGFIPLYRKLGRERFISLLKENPQASRKQLKQILSDAVQAEKAAREEQQKRQNPSLFD